MFSLGIRGSYGLGERFFKSLRLATRYNRAGARILLKELFKFFILLILIPILLSS